MKVGYFVKKHGHSIVDTRYFRDFDKHDTIESIAEDAAEYAWNNNDGWEWLRDEVFTIVKGDEILGDCKIEMDPNPIFYVREIK